MFTFKPNTTDFLLMTTSRIIGEDSERRSTLGTGFFFHAVDGNEDSTLLITNRHVIEDMVVGEFHLHLHEDGRPQTPSLSWVSIKPPDFRKWWIAHPNPDVDLAAALVNQMIDAAGVDPDCTTLCDFGPPHIATDAELQSYGAIEDVAMIGYPAGFCDDLHNLPVIRRGSTASHPGIPFRGGPYGVIDMACLWGSSGSPIVSHNEGAVINAKHPSAQIRGKQILLGILSDSVTMTLQGEVRTATIPTKQKQIAEISSPIHLGRYVRAAELLPLADETMKRLQH